MVIHDDKSVFGWEGDEGLGERLIQRIIDGTKTATCAPKSTYERDELEALHATVGKIVTVTNHHGTPKCNIRMIDVFETTFGSPDQRLVNGEGNGRDVEQFKREHIAAWDGMETDDKPLTDDTVLVVELFELVEVAE